MATISPAIDDGFTAARLVAMALSSGVRFTPPLPGA
jgi:hypothetical protein